MLQVLWQMLWQAAALVSAPAFWLMAAVVYWQIRSRAKRKAEMFQLPQEPVLGLTVYTVLAGMLGGLLASWLLLLLGVSAERIGIAQIWILALLLMLIRQRFFCFAYAGGILAVLHCLTGWPNIDVSQLLALVAILHCTEAFLVLTAGNRNGLPVYLQDEDGRTVGGFLLQMTWPLPLMMLFAMAGGAAQPQAGFFVFQDTWPVIGESASGAGNQLYVLLPVLAALGYSDAAVNCTAEQKTRQSALLLLLYSGCLLCLVLLTDGNGAWQMLPALFAPLGHEFMIFSGKRNLLCSGAKSYQASSQGIVILDVQRCSPARRAGLKRGDVIISLDGQPIINRQHFLERQFCLPDAVLIEYRRRGKIRKCLLHRKNQLQMGIITVPDASCNLYWTLEKDEGITKFLEKKCEKTLKNVR